VSTRGGDVDQLYSEIAALGREADDHVVVALSLNNLAETDLRLGRLTAAATHLREALRYSVERGMEHITALGLIAIARIAESLDDQAIAVRLHANAELRLAQTGTRMYPDDEEVSKAMLTRTAIGLGTHRYQTARSEGEALTNEAALTIAESVLDLAIGLEDPATPQDL